MKKSKRKILVAIFFVSVFALYSFPNTSLAVDGWITRTSAGSRAWTAIASSSDGTKLAATVSPGFIYTSTDSGATWTERAASRNWFGIASSADGVNLAAVDNNTGLIYVSTDSGVNWTSQASGSRTWRTITSDSTGTKLTAAGFNTLLYTSISGGAWTAGTVATASNWFSLASSSDGVKLAAVVNGGNVWISTDSGASWVKLTGIGSKGYLSVASSADGSKLVAVVGGGSIHTSTNLSDIDAAWTTRAAVRNWQSVASSSDGTMLAAVDSGGNIWTSTNTGVSWTAQTEAGTQAWKAIASSSDGTKLAAVVAGGNIFTYGTLNPPTVTTDVASSVNQTSATLSGNITSVGTSTGGVTQRGFHYGPTTSYGTTSIETGDFPTGTFTADVSSLNCGIMYHFRAYAISSSGTALGGDASFTTSPCDALPTVTTNGSSTINQTNVTLSGEITNIGVSQLGVTERGFNYGPSVSYGQMKFEAGNFSPEIYSLLVNSLNCGTLYHFRAYAINGFGTALGADDTFTTAPCDAVPVVVTIEATSINQTDASLTGEITDVGVSLGITERGFNYGLSTSYGSTEPETGTFTAGSFSLPIDSLSCGTTYHFRGYAISSAGTARGGDASFLTAPCDTLPVVSTNGSSLIHEEDVTLSGEITNIGISELGVTERGFEYGPTTDYSSGQTAVELGTFTAEIYSSLVSSLSCATVYHFRAYAVNSVGIAVGDDATFTTADCQIISTTSNSSSSRSRSRISRSVSSAISSVVPLLQANLPNVGEESGCLPTFRYSPNTGEICPVFVPINVPADCLPSFNFSPTTGASCPLGVFQFSNNLTLGTASPDVKELQKFLNTHGHVLSPSGPGSVGNETSFFGALTKAALIKFQIASGISPSTGFFGPMTRGVVNFLLK